MDLIYSRPVDLNEFSSEALQKVADIHGFVYLRHEGKIFGISLPDATVPTARTLVMTKVVEAEDSKKIPSIVSCLLNWSQVKEYFRRNWIFIAIGIFLAEAAKAYAYDCRGYEGVGSEFFVLPAFLCLVEFIRWLRSPILEKEE